MSASLIFIGAFLILTLLGPVTAAPQARVTIAAGPPNWPATLLLVRLAALISQNTPNVQAAVETTAGPIDNIRLIGARRADIGFAGNGIVEDAYYGRGTFAGNPVPLRLLTPLWSIPIHLVTIEGTGINSIGDLRGKRVSLGVRGTPVERDALRVLRAAGIDPERDIRSERLGFGEAPVALREKKIDAFFYADVGALPVGDILALATTPGIRLKLVSLDSVLPALQKEFGNAFRTMTIRKEYYPGLAADVPTVGGDFLLVAHQDLSMDLAYQITKLIFERRGELAQTAKEAQLITLNELTGRSTVPFHQGAVRYYKERGAKGF